MKLKLCNNGLSVHGINKQGFNVSYSIEAEEYKQWISEGNTPEPEFTEEEIEAQRIQAIKSKASELITSKYPEYKQLNIMRTGGAELETMSAYIDSIREISNKAEQDETKVEDVQWQ